ncbi:response regulator [Gimesia aquarii]|uniref:Response regulator rcp1 n=1 Tax=Gimesia aquarii TaxID=2527964 RepID=A0A517X048_9PLAN|nr:response regulator [Gimesia aquarii]QDU10880.1 Response regulator rcp1 [Gimesia aquarii]
MVPEHARPINILLIEDDEDDVELIKRSLKRDRIVNTFTHVSDGIMAMEYLRKQGEFTDAIRPDLILLDLNMPRMDGREVLRQCREDESMDTIPIVIFTSSDDEQDILASYKYKANSYVTKPIDLVQFRDVLTGLSKYWFCIVTLPPTDDNR